MGWSLKSNSWFVLFSLYALNIKEAMAGLFNIDYLIRHTTYKLPRFQLNKNTIIEHASNVICMLHLIHWIMFLICMTCVYERKNKAKLHSFLMYYTFYVTTSQESIKEHL